MSNANLCERKFAEEMATMGLIQFNHIPNKNNVFLDLFLSNEFPLSQVEMVSPEDAFDQSTRHHLPLSTKVSTCLSDLDFPVAKTACKLLLRQSSGDVSKWCTFPLYSNICSLF